MKKEKEPLKPVLTPVVTHVVMQEPPHAGDYEIVKVDKDGKEIAGTEFITSIRMFNQVYVKQSYIIKKK